MLCQGRRIALRRVARCEGQVQVIVWGPYSRVQNTVVRQTIYIHIQHTLRAHIHSILQRASPSDIQLSPLVSYGPFSKVPSAISNTGLP